MKAESKGRVVFQGNRVTDEAWNAALFSELGSAPATMEAGKACDAYGCAPGHAVQQADAEHAYVQARLGGDAATWVRLPRDRQPPSWRRFRDPVCPLALALYGQGRVAEALTLAWQTATAHPDSPLAHYTYASLLREHVPAATPLVLPSAGFAAAAERLQAG